MSIFLVTRRGAAGECVSGRGFVRFTSGRCTGLVAALLACLALACSDDETDPAEQTGSAGGVNTPDASARILPGDGREGTPEFDTNTTQREPIGPNELVETIEGIRNGIDRGRIDGVPVEDAAAPAPAPVPVDESDAGAN